MAIYFRKSSKENLSQCRGLDAIDINLWIILVKESVERSAQAYSSLKQMTVWERDIYNREVVIHHDSTFIFKFQGHLWSMIFTPFMLTPEEDAQSISRILSTDVIYYYGSDTSGTKHYHFFNNGISVERFYYETGVIKEFDSQRRRIDVDNVKPYKFTNNFIHEQNAFVPCLIWDFPEYEKKFVTGNRTILYFEDLCASEIARMDYLAKDSIQNNQQLAQEPIKEIPTEQRSTSRGFVWKVIDPEEE